MSCLWQWRFPGNCFVGGFLDIGWGFVVPGSCCLCSSLGNSLELAPCSYRCSLGQEYCSSIVVRWMNCIGAYFALGVGSCSIADVVVGERTFQRFYFLRIHSLVGLLTEHLRGPSRCVLGR